MKMNLKLTVILLAITTLGCGLRINQNFNYDKQITPTEIAEDIEDLKKSLVKYHFDINWEGKQSSIWKSLDSILLINNSITIDSFENLLSLIINKIDDGHSKVKHQDSIKFTNSNQFGFQSISDSMAYLRIGNFMDTKMMLQALNKFKLNYNNNPKNKIIIDIRSNLGGNIQNVNRALTYFLPSNSKLYEKVEMKEFNFLVSKLASIALSAKQNLKLFKYTGKKKINGNPQIYLWIDESIASGSMLLSYHLQNHGAIIIGETPQGVFNTFGNQYGHRLKNSNIIYTLSSIRVYLTEESVTRMEDMLTPNYIPSKKWSLSDLVNYINTLE